MPLAFDLPPLPTLPIAGREHRFPVARVYCVGRNYAEHAREMGGEPEREPPFFFTKSAYAVAPCERDGDGTWRTTVAYPPATEDLHHEVELVVALGPGDGPGGVAIFGQAVGIDLTRRDLQARAKAARRPWDMAKSFTGAAPIGPVHPLGDTWPLRSGAISLAVDGDGRQSGDLNQMIWSVGEILEELARYDALRPGDLIFTGTPAGVGAVAPGQTMTAAIAGLGEISVSLAPRS
jgi:fumarylpyruvate hydrolase